jgi:hypothetical protein
MVEVGANARTSPGADVANLDRHPIGVTSSGSGKARNQITGMVEPAVIVHVQNSWNAHPWPSDAELTLYLAVELALLAPIAIVACGMAISGAAKPVRSEL